MPCNVRYQEQHDYYQCLNDVSLSYRRLHLTIIFLQTAMHSIVKHIKLYDVILVSGLRLQEPKVLEVRDHLHRPVYKNP